MQLVANPTVAIYEVLSQSVHVPTVDWPVGAVYFLPIGHLQSLFTVRNYGSHMHEVLACTETLFVPQGVHRSWSPTVFKYVVLLHSVQLPTCSPPLGGT